MSHVTQVTEVKNFHKADTFAVAGSTAPTVILAAAKPATTANSAVFGSSLNYLKLKMYVSSNNAPTFYVFGWNFSAQLNAFVPQLLTSFTTTLSAATQSLAAVGLADTLYEVTFAALATGDVKVFSGITSTTPGGFVLIDTLGSEFIDIRATSAAGTPTVYVLQAGL